MRPQPPRALLLVPVLMLMLVLVAGCAGTRLGAVETPGPGGVLTVPSEATGAAGAAASPSRPAPVPPQALEAARTVTLALAGGDDSADLAGLLAGGATQAVPAELDARAEVNASLLARDGTTMHAQVLDGQEQTIYTDDTGMVLMVYTLSWQAPPERTAPPPALDNARPGDAPVTAWEVTLTRGASGWQVADVTTGSGH